MKKINFLAIALIAVLLASCGKTYNVSVEAENKALEGEIELVIYVKKGSNGAYIEKLSHFRKQRELLLDKDNLYRVLSRKGNIVELEVIEYAG